MKKCVTYKAKPVGDLFYLEKDPEGEWVKKEWVERVLLGVLACGKGGMDDPAVNEALRMLRNE